MKYYNSELRIYTTGNISAEIEIELLKDKELIIFETAVSTQYHMYKKIFENTGFQALPKRKPWDHTVNLKPDMIPQKLTKAYPISSLEDKAMKVFNKENLANGRIKPSQSPWAFGLLFYKEKKWETMTNTRLPSIKLCHCQKCIPITTTFPISFDNSKGQNTLAKWTSTGDSITFASKKKINKKQPFLLSMDYSN